jgi:uncharacterized protein with PQ loop repeat
MDWYWIFVIAVSVSVNVPQIIKIVRGKRSDNVSAWTYGMLLFVNVHYWYRSVFILHDWVFITSNSISTIVTLSVLYCIWKFRGNGG